MKIVHPNGTIGIIGGGQLGRMMIYRSKKLGFRFAVLDENEAPAQALSDVFIKGSLKDADALEELSKVSDVLTYEIEHINTAALENIHSKGKVIYPSPDVLAVIQDKLLQKELFVKKGLPTAPFFKEDDPCKADFSARVFPLVQKSRREGYDGRGVKILKSANDEPMSPPSIFEEMVDIDKELAVMVSRSIDGSLALFPVTEMAFNPDHNICDTVITPARINEKTAAITRDIAVSVVESLNGIGIFGVELFLDTQGKVLVNEVAPRPHNSGHYTMEACVTCQFEQHVRAICGLPLGDTTLLRPAVMVNLLGQPNSSGAVAVHGLDRALQVAGFSPHFYGKSQTRPFRKMGHFTVTSDTLEDALKKAEYVRSFLKISSITLTGETK
ncbi:MAG: 5-(carboxyamino)imidazole ribonucleotide synthase [Treponema sp.]|jgi:5-(carboxyamino)imidazole ribonucleotide synthase|nr:5-(carboxyamino)imidazole ribonucleotide synthase [Treponema sp.]